jgi:phage virion morphogenesis protein
MTGIAIVLEGRDHADATLARAIAALDDATEMFDRIGVAMVASTQLRFETEKGPAGNPWPASLRAQMSPAGKTLFDTGRLFGSFAREAGPDQVAWGTNEIYARIHQTGGVIRAKTKKGLRFRPFGGGGKGGDNEGFVVRQSVTLPARPFLGVDDSDERAISRIAGEYLAEALGADG